MALIVCMTCLFSCYDEDMLDPDTDSIEVTPEVIFPVGKLELTLGDLLEDNLGEDQDIDVDPTTGVYFLKHVQENIAEFKIEDVLEFPTETIPVSYTIPIDGFLGSFSGNANTIPGSIDLSFPAINKELTIETGKTGVILKTLDCDFVFDLGLGVLPFDYNISVVFEGNSSMNIDQNVNHGDTAPTFRFPGSNISFNTTDSAKRNKLIMTATITILRGDYYVDFSSIASGIPLNFSMKEFVFKKAEGDFGNLTVDFDPDSFDIDMGELDDLSGKFGFTDPIIKMILHNRNMGFKFELDLDLEAVNDDGSKVSIKKPSADRFIVDQLSAPSSSIVTQCISYTKDNSNIVSFMDAFPLKRVEYSGSFNLNPSEGGDHYPDLTKGEYNFITSDASLNFDVEIKIPFKFNPKDVSYKYSIEDVDLGIDEEMKEKIISAGLIFKAKNGWPVGINFDNMIFKDVNNVELARMEGNVLKAPKVDSNGNAIGNETSHIAKTVFSNDVIDILDKVKNIELLIKLDVDSSATNGVSFTEAAKLNLVIGIEAKLDLSQTI